MKQLESGLLLVTGPFAVSGVPLRRVNQRFCIATSTKVKVGDAKDVSDAFFAKDAKKKAKKTESGFFSANTPTSLKMSNACYNFMSGQLT